MKIQEKSLVSIYEQCFKTTDEKLKKYIHGNDDWYINDSEAILINLSHEITNKNFIPKKVYYYYDK